MLDAFVAAQIQDQKRSPAEGDPARRDCLQVLEVAAGSVADVVGIVPGDLLVEVDGKPAAPLGTEFHRDLSDRRSYFFHSPRRLETLGLTATGIALGMELSPTRDSIAASFKPKEDDHDQLLALWKMGEWELLEELASKVTEKRGLLGVFGGAERDTPTLALLGAARFEQGERERAFDAFEEYMEKYSENWTMDFAGLCEYYLALDLRDRGEMDEAREHALTAHRQARNVRTADLLEELEGSRPPLRPARWQGETIPGYELPRLEEEGPAIRLSSTLDALEPGEHLITCWLSSYRGNGPYDEFMQDFRHYCRFFSPHVKALHVITEEPKRKRGRAYWHEAEDRCRQEGLPFHVLLDEGADLTVEIDPTESPYFLLLDHEGIVRGEESLEPIDLWRALARG